MSDINIDDFFKDAAIALVQLYGVFPRRQAVFVEDICGPDDTDEFGMHALEKQIAEFDDDESDKEIRKKLQGLGYISLPCGPPSIKRPARYSMSGSGRSGAWIRSGSASRVMTAQPPASTPAAGNNNATNPINKTTLRIIKFSPVQQ